MSCDFRALANEGVQKISPYVPGKPEDELQRELGLPRIVKLASNENPLGPSPKVVEAIQKKLNAITRYPDGNGFELKQALAAHLSVGADMLTLGNGSNDLLELIAKAFCGPGSEVLFSEYAFAVYPLAALSAGATPVVAPATNWGYDLAALKACITDRTRVIFIANPNNPTGTWLTQSELLPFLDEVPENILVVLDEAYSEYVASGDYPDGVSLLGRYPNLIVTRTFSKAYGLAALRVGYSVSHPDVADVLNRVRQPFNVDTFAQVAAVAALKDTEYLARTIKTNHEGLAQLVEGFEALGLEYIPSVGNFICVKVGPKAGEINKAMLAQGVIVRPVANYNMPEHLRVSVGVKEENEFMLSALKKALSDL